MILMIPLSYIGLKLGGTPELVFVIQLVITFAAQISMLLIIKPLIHLSLKEYSKEVFVKPSIVTILASIAPISVHHLLDDGIISTVIVLFICFASVIFFIYFIGLNSIEKESLNSKIRLILSKFK